MVYLTDQTKMVAWIKN